MARKNDYSGKDGTRTVGQQRQYLVAKEAADYLRMTLRSLHERTSQRTIPYRRMAGMRRLLFVPAELDAWLEGADLETIEKDDGSLIVRPA